MFGLEQDATAMNIASLPHLLARFEGDRIAIVEADGRALSYGDFDRLSVGIAHRLRQGGLRRGDVCALMIHDDGLHLAALFAVWRLGAILLPLDWRAASGETATIIGKFKPRLVVARSGQRMPAGVAVLPLVPPLSEVPGELPVEPVTDEVALYALSSGTTGEPKAVVISHRQHYARIASFIISCPILRDDRYLSTAPLAYSWGRNLALSHLCLGATLILHPPLSGPEQVAAAVEAQGASAAAAVPKLSRALLGLPVATAPLLGRLRRYYSATAPLFGEERREFRERITPNLTEIYGATETGGLCILRPEDQTLAPLSVGRPAIGVEIEIVDPEDRPLPAGETGRIRCRGPNLASGYLHGSDEDNARFVDGWYYTGDLGRVDASGFVHLEGRSAEIIKRGGITIHAAEIERVLAEHPAVSEAAVIGLKSANLDEVIAAFVVLRYRVDHYELEEHCVALLASHKRPRRITILPALPRNAAGKVLKSALSTAIASEHRES